MSIPRRASELALLASLTLAAGPALGQDRNAEELFQLGKSAIERRDYEKACGYFQASLDAEFTLGTLLNLAICHERSGKIATAWAEYRVLDDRARRSTPPQADRAHFAQTRASALYPRLSRVRIILSPEAAAITGLVVKLDGTPVARELFDVGVPVDTGQRQVSAVAPEHEGWSQAITVTDERLSLSTTIPGLPSVAPPPPPPAALERRDDPSAPESSRRTVGFVIGGIGLAALAAGGVFGILAFAASEDATCPAPCLPAKDGDNPTFVKARDAYERADTLGWISNATLAAGIVGVGAGAYFVLTAPSAKRSTPADRRSHARPAAIRVSALGAGAGVTLGGDF